MDNLELIFIPTPGAGHLVPTLELAIRLLDRDERVSVTVLAINSPFASLDSHIESVVSSRPRITLINLPHVEPPPSRLRKSIVPFLLAYIESHAPHVRQILSSRAGSVAAVIFDFLCEPMICVAKEFGLPTYIYQITSAAFLGLMRALLDDHNLNPKESYTRSDHDLSVPSFFNPVPALVLPWAFFDGEHGGYSTYIKIARRYWEVDGILVNTYTDLEPYDLSSLFDNQRVYKIGPLLSLEGFPHPDMDLTQWDNIRKWLDDQPSFSVLLLCFGSKGAFGEAQVREIATAIEHSGKRFLWSLRLTGGPTEPQKNKIILPEGFSERTRGRGVVCGWVPQMEVLAHRAIGGFVSHCGWNSILESLWHGVPIATWPKYAEQQLNAFWMVKEKGLAVELRLDYRDGDPIVEAGEIERAIARLADGDSELKEKVKAMKNMARKAVMEGGSSFNDMGRFIEGLITR